MDYSIGKGRELTFEEAGNDPRYFELVEAIRFMEAHENDWVFPQKDRMEHKRWLQIQLPRLLESQPDATLVDAVKLALEPVPGNVNAETIQVIVAFTIKEWEKINESIASKAERNWLA